MGDESTAIQCQYLGVVCTLSANLTSNVHGRRSRRPVAIGAIGGAVGSRRAASGSGAIIEQRGGGGNVLLLDAVSGCRGLRGF